MNEELIIDPEFQAQIFALTDEEFNLLEQNILDEGRVIHPIITWNNIIVDGHNRYRICQQHPEIIFTIYEKSFPNRDAVLAWICKNQLGRRNLTPTQRTYLIGKQYEAEKASHGGDRKSEETKSSYQNGNLILDQKTCERLAEENHIGRTSIVRAERFSKGLDAAEEIQPGIRDEILSGSKKVLSKDVEAIAQADPEDRKDLVEALSFPKSKNAPGKRSREPSKSLVSQQTRKSEEVIPDFEFETGDDTEEETADEEAYSIETESAETAEAKPKKLSDREIMKQIREISEGMAHSEGILALGTVEDMIYEMNSAMNDMIWRWENIKDTYPRPLQDKGGRQQIIELANQCIDFCRQIKKGKLWK